MKTNNGTNLGSIAMLVLIAGGAAVLTAWASVSENAEPLSWTKADFLGAMTVSSVPGAAGRVVVAFPQQNPENPPSAAVVYLVTGGDPQMSPFAGNYVTAGMRSLAFKIGTSIVGNPASAILVTTDGTQWRHDVQMPQTVGGWVTNTVPLEWDALWYKNNLGDGDAASWTRALTSVSHVGLIVDRWGQTNQTVTVDSFILAGTGFITPPASLLSFGDTLEARFGVRNYADLTAAQRALDTDSDGMKDVDEILAGTNPDNRNSVFAATVLGTTSSGVTIQWPCVNGGVYTVSRSRDLVSGTFGALQGGYRLASEHDGTMTYTDTTVQANGGPYFYRIVKE